jgi:hypothetical protein
MQHTFTTRWSLRTASSKYMTCLPVAFFPPPLRILFLPCPTLGVSVESDFEVTFNTDCRGRRIGKEGGLWGWDGKGKKLYASRWKDPMHCPPPHPPPSQTHRTTPHTPHSASASVMLGANMVASGPRCSLRTGPAIYEILLPHPPQLHRLSACPSTLAVSAGYYFDVIPETDCRGRRTGKEGGA